MSSGDRSGTLTHAEDEQGRRRASSGAALYLALECERPLARSARHALGAIDEVVIGRAAERTVVHEADARARRLALGVPDRWMSGTHARLTRVLGRWLVEDAGSKNGTLLRGAPVERAELQDGDLLEVGHTFFVFREEGPAGVAAPAPPAALADAPPGLRTLSPGLAADFARLAGIARSEVSVIVRGESGTGKELAARAVHALSGRSGAFVAVNCGALPVGLVGSELFGHRRGAFSGASEDRLGLVRSADGGTLFLDEVGDLPLDAQPALLRVLQEREVVPVGTERPVRVDVRLVAATHRDLDARVEAGSFRQDLLARLGGFSLVLPPLRARRAELGLVVAEVLTRALGSRAESVRFAIEAARALVAYDWPANVRELEKALGAAVVLSGDGPVRLEHLPEALRRAAEPPAAVVPGVPRVARPLSDEDARRKDELVALLRAHGGNVSAVARALGKARMQVQRWLKRYGLDPEAFKG